MLGVMSGTSLDGVDIAQLRFEVSAAGQWSYKITTAQTIPYTQEWVATLRAAIWYAPKELEQLNVRYTEYLALVISEFISKNKLKNLDAVCSHGHTILHQPAKGVTLQIGNLPLLATLLQQNIVCDFRVQDVQLGGQGAPLVPIGDALLFSEYDYCLNLGGFANCSSQEHTQSVAYDICPVNIVLNPLAEILGFPFDDCGKIASQGVVNKKLLQQLNALKFYSLPEPKSLGLEWVQECVVPLLAASEISVENKIATFTEHVAQQIAAQCKAESSVLVTGGGAYNSFLLERVKAYKNLKLIVPDKTLIEFKEALVFGLLGVLRLRDEINCLASVTGASKDHSSGKVFKKP